MKAALVAAVLAQATLDESTFVRAALERSPAVRAARSELEAARADVAATALSALPDVQLTARYARLSSLPERYRTLSLPGAAAEAAIVLPQLLDALLARATLAIPITDALVALTTATAQVRSIEQARALELGVARARLAFEARAAFATCRRAWLADGVARSALEVSSVQERVEQERLLAGASSATQLALFTTQRLAAEERRIVASSELTAAHAILAQLVPGVPLLEPRLEELPGAPAEFDAAQTPTVRALRALEDAARAAQATQALALVPRLTAAATGDVSAPSPRAFGADRLEAVPTWEASVQLEFSLSALTLGSARRARAAAEVEVARLRVEEARRQLEAQWRSARATVDAADRRVSLLAERVRVATRLAEARQVERLAGVSSALEVTVAQGDLVRSRLELADAEVERHLARARVLVLSGSTELEEGS